MKFAITWWKADIRLPPGPAIPEIASFLAKQPFRCYLTALPKAAGPLTTTSSRSGASSLLEPPGSRPMAIGKKTGLTAVAQLQKLDVSVTKDSMTILLLVGAALISIQNVGAGDAKASASVIAPAAQIEAPPSRKKLALIRRFLVAIGRQKQLDTGAFLERYAIPSGPMWQLKSGPVTENMKDGFEKRRSALIKAYERHRSAYQQAYEHHVNWEFTEEELTQIVDFLERPVGQHYLDGRWRMETYVGTDTEELEQQIVAEAQDSLTSR